MNLTSKQFDKIVAKAIRGIPDEIRRHLDNVIISVRKHPTREMMEELNLPPGEEPLGFYAGASLRERSFFSPPDYPDAIFIFQEPLEGICETQEQLEEEIRITVVHEIAHFLGLSEDRLYELGYE